MGTLVPENFPMRSLINDEERAVVEALRDRLSDSWCVIPDVGIAGVRDHQIDVVIADERDGVAVIEVKGHRADLRAGLFQSANHPLDPQPHVQARKNAYALRDLLRAASPALKHLRVEYGIVLPNTGSLRGRLPPDLLATQVMTGAFFDDPADCHRPAHVGPVGQPAHWEGRAGYGRADASARRRAGLGR